jgi:hypothetical protein
LSYHVDLNTSPPFFLYFTQFSFLNFPASLVFEGTACGLHKGWSYHGDLSRASEQSCPYVAIFGLCWEEIWSSMLKGLYMGSPGREHEIIKTKILPELE